MTTSLDPNALHDLKTRHVAWLEARLVSPRAEAEWRANLPALYEALLATRLGALVDLPALTHALEATLTRAQVEGAARPAARRALDLLLRELKAETGTVGDRFPAEAKKKLDRLLERPNLLPERFLREVVEQEAMQEVMRDVLYDALKEFNDKVNPFFAEWGLPALLKKFVPFGGGLGKGLESVRGEFDKRLEPELRKFLQSASKKGLKRMVDFTLAKADEPRFVEVRKHLAAWVLAQEIAVLARAVDPEVLALGQGIALDVAAEEAERAATRARARAIADELVGARRDRTVREVLAELGVTLQLDFDAIAAATWPAVRSALSSEPARAWFAALIGEFYDAEIAAAAPAAPAS